MFVITIYFIYICICISMFLIQLLKI